MPFQCFHKCYESLVQSVIDYSSAVWGTRSYSWIDAVQNRACRYFLGLGKYAPNQAINGDMGWKQPEHRQWLAVARKFCRMIHMDDELLTKQIFSGCMAQANSSSCNTWFYRVTTFCPNKLSMSRSAGTVVYRYKLFCTVLIHNFTICMSKNGRQS